MLKAEEWGELSAFLPLVPSDSAEDQEHSSVIPNIGTLFNAMDLMRSSFYFLVIKC